MLLRSGKNTDFWQKEPTVEVSRSFLCDMNSPLYLFYDDIGNYYIADCDIEQIKIEIYRKDFKSLEATRKAANKIYKQLK